MPSLRRFLGVLSMLSLLQFSLQASEGTCDVQHNGGPGAVMEGGQAHASMSMAMAMDAAGTVGTDNAPSESVAGSTDVNDDAPCHGPLSPATCATMAMCHGLAVASVSSVRSSMAPVAEMHFGEPLQLQASAKPAPQPPPPRA